MNRDISTTVKEELGTSKQPPPEEATAESTAPEESFAESHRSPERDKMNTLDAPVTIKSDELALPLFPPRQAESFRSRWQDIQVEFVDDPRNSVKQADQLVANAVEHLTQGLANECHKLEQYWDGNESPSTEDLRLLLCRYRSFFERLMSI